MNNIFEYLFASGSSGTSSLDNPQAWLVNAFAGRATTSGERVTSDSSLTLPVYFACLRNLAEDLGKLPLLTYQREGEEKTRATNHPVYRLMHDEPNPEMSAAALIEALMLAAAGWGGGFAEIERDGLFKPKALWPIHPSRVRIKRDRNGVLYYEVRADDLKAAVQAVRIEAADMFHLRGVGPTGIEGYSVLALAAESIGLSLAAQRFGASFFGSGASLGGVLEHPGKLLPEARATLRESWQSRHGGAANAGKTAILEEGMKFSKIGIPPEEAQFLETRQFQVEDICRWFRMPPRKVGYMAQAQGWATVEASNKDYVTDTLLPWANRWKQECARKLFTEAERGKFFCEFLFTALLQADAKDRALFYKSMLETASITPNQIAAAENLPVFPGGDIRLIPSSLQTVEAAAKAGQQPPPAPASPASPPVAKPRAQASAAERVEALAPVFLDAATRLLAKEAHIREEKKGKGTEWIPGFIERHGRTSMEAFEPVARALGLEPVVLRFPLGLHIHSLRGDLTTPGLREPTTPKNLAALVMDACITELLTKEPEHVAAA